MKALKKVSAVIAAVVIAVLLGAGQARADDGARVGWGFLFPIPIPLPIYQLPHEPSPVTFALLFPIPVPIPVYDYPYYRHAREVPVPVEEREYGGLQTMVYPREADVYIDGRYAGKTGDFYLRKDALSMYAGTHEVEFRAPGYKSYRVEVRITPGGLVVIKYDLEPRG